MSKLDSYQSKMDSLEEHFKNIERINNDVDEKLSRFNSERLRIDTMSQKFDKLVSLSDSMDKKISELHSTSDDLQNMQLTVKGFNESLDKISERYDRLDKKSEMIDMVSDEVDKTFQNLKDVEEKVKTVSDSASVLPEQLSDIQQQVSFLIENKDSITDALDKVSDLKNILTDAEKRAEQLQISRQGIARSETRLENISRSIDEKIRDLAKYNGIEGDMEVPLSQPSSYPYPNDFSPQDKARIIQLKRRGWSLEEIARNMKRSISEIEIVLELGLEE